MKVHFFILLLVTAHLSAPQSRIVIAEGSFKIPAFSEENIYFGCAKGDRVIFNLKEQNGKELRGIELIEYPATSRYMEFRKHAVANKSILITNTGVFQFRLSNQALGGRVCSYKIERIPVSLELKDFNTTVYWETRYDTTYMEGIGVYLARQEYVPQVVVPFSAFYINSGSNATLFGGTSRITIPVTIPENTVKWYYEFSASRNEKDLDQVRESFGLFGQLVQAVEPGLAIASLGAGLLASPPGSDYCDVHLLDSENKPLFERKVAFKYYPDGSRENLKSGIVEVEWGVGRHYYIGIKNPDHTHGIHISLEVVAIVYEEEYAERIITVPQIRTYEVPYLKLNN